MGSVNKFWLPDIRTLKIIISTIPLGHGGAGDYLYYIRRFYPDYYFLRPIIPKLATQSLIYRMIYGIETILLRIFVISLAKLRVLKSVVLHHPQTLGYRTAELAISSSKNVEYWVVDTSIFCKQSYNNFDGAPCFNCIAEFKPRTSCKHFPRVATDQQYQSFLNSIRKHSGKIVFHVQTQ